MKPRVGVHTSVRKGFVRALQDAVDLGCETVQMFTQSPRGWRTRVYTEKEFNDFRTARKKYGIDPVVVHTPYLPNLCTSNEDLYQKSIQAFQNDLTRCEQLGADYLVIHPGAYSPDADLQTGLKRFVDAFNLCLKKVPGKTRVLIENMAGGGRRIGGDFKEVAYILNEVKDKNRVGVCFDTCHAIGAGYDVSSKEGIEATIAEIEKTFGLNNIYVFHVNDSRGALKSHRDLHQHLGQGYIGLKGFKTFFNRPEFKNCAYILETPKDSPEADPRNIKMLRECLQ